MGGRKYRFFLKSDSFTNESVASLLVNMRICDGFQSEIIYKEKALKVWEISHYIITQLENGRVVFPFRFQIFQQEGDGKIRLYTLYKKRKASVYHKKAERKLEEIVAKNRKAI